MPCNRTLLDFNRTPRRPLRVILEDLQDLAHPVHIEVLGEVPPLGFTGLADEPTVLGTHTEVLDVSDKELLDRFASGITTIAALSLALNYPTIVSVMHSLVNSYKNLIAVALATEYSFEGAEKVRVAFPFHTRL